MKKNFENKGNDDLRRKAEKLQRKKPRKINLQLSKIDALQLIQELEVHQIELNLQNEELKLAMQSAQDAIELYDFAPSGYFTLSKKGKIIKLNLNGSQMLGKERLNLINTSFSSFVNENTRPDFNSFLRKIFISNKKETCEVIISFNGNPQMCVQLNGIVAEDNAYCLLTAVDISERKQSEEKLKLALEEKEVLLRELYHRTKNNMQVVYSFLGLKAETIEDEKTKAILKDMGTRIQSIALVHQKLYHSHNLSRIDLKEYITDLVQLLMNSYSSAGKDIKLSLNLESIDVLIDTAIPCGLLINEIISNSFKHGFKNRRGGRIAVKLIRENQDIIELLISDNGVGISKGIDLFSENTLGLRLFMNIVEEQLQGNVVFETKKGVSCSIRFKDIFYKERV
jgi:two-component sensor histidine kinase